MRVRGAWSLVLIATAVFSCTKLRPNRCDNGGDCASGSCNPSTLECVPVDGGTGGSGGGGAGGAAGAKGTGGTPFICPNPLCKSNSNTPICDVDAGSCRGCNNVESTTACRSLDAGTNACVSAADAGTSLGMCVVCVSNKDCSGDRPVCDPTSNTCVGCLANSDCAGTTSPPSTTPICELIGNSTAPIDTCRSCSKDAECNGPGICMADGHCAGANEVMFVDENSTTCGDGSSATIPLCLLPTAVGQLGTQKHVIVILGPVSEQLTLGTTNFLPVIIGRQNASGAASIPAAGKTAITVSSDSVLIRDLTVTGGLSTTSKGVLVTGATATVKLLRVTANLMTSGLGIDAENGATLVMDQCYVENNPVGGILINSATAMITNTVIAVNGGTTGYGVQFNIPGASTQFAFNTVVGNPTAATSDFSHSVSLNNSIVAGPTTNCTPTNSFTGTSVPPFSSANPYHLTAPAGCPMAPSSPIPPYDIDGQPRVAPIDCGADQFSP